ncbi:MAG: hypothetical protein VSS75_022145, partial [Candidatus Parabeggiatoa sp.]|nr:hypothetical protein [Candidatus Parabeggiatoa sp.]
LAILRFLAAEGEGAIMNEETLRTQCPDEFESSLGNLLQRELIEEVLGKKGYRFQVELIRRWFVM